MDEELADLLKRDKNLQEIIDSTNSSIQANEESIAFAGMRAS